MLQKKIANFLFSTRLMAVLFIVFALAMAVATFLENSYSTAFARIYVYNTKWFELIILLLALNFIGNIERYKLYRRPKWPTLLFHLAFLMVIVGAAVTRYASFEGMMPIKNGETSNTFYSQKTFLTAYIDGEANGQMMRRSQDFNVLLAAHANNHHVITTDFKDQKIEFEITKFIHGAKKTIVQDSEGERYLKIVDAGSGQRQEHFIEEGKVLNINNILFAFNKQTEGAINIQLDDEGNYTLNSPFEGSYMRMADQKQSRVVADSTQQLAERSLYNVGGLRFVFPDPVIRGHYDIVHDKTKEKNGDDGVIVKVKTKGETKELKLLGSQGGTGNFEDVSMGGLDIHLRYGSKEYKLPFALHLDKFIAEKYPGTANNPQPSYSSFKSKVSIIENDKIVDKADIYMNHVLDRGGYRFFQSSFMPGEAGTVLSVNHDWWGTNITYLGYTLLYLGLVLILFVKGSRFKELGEKLKRLKKTKEKQRAKLTGVITILLLLASFSSFAQSSKEDIPGYDEAQQHQHDSIVSRGEEVNAAQQRIMMGQNLSKKALDSVIVARAIPEQQSDAFGSLVLQDYGGRMKPVNTYSSELLRKVSKSDHYAGLNSDQVLLSMTQYPFLWYNVPLIKINRQNDSIHQILGLEKGHNLAKFTQFFDHKGNYKFGPYLEEAYRAKVKSQFQKDLTKIDGQVNLLYNALQGDLLKIFPIPNDTLNNKWVSYPEALDTIQRFHGKDSLFVANALPLYSKLLAESQKAGDYTKANSLLESIKAFQHKYGEQVMPSDNHIQAEILYNKYDVFQNLFWQYLLAGLFTFIFVIIEIFSPKKWIKWMINVGSGITLLLFIVHTIALITRWYISGHAPWSDAYESMIYVAWATMLFGLIFGRRSKLTLSSTAFVTSMVLMIAHWNWMDPSIGHLEPVLDSYWIMIHTSIIVGSYGPFTIAAILGLVSLFLIILTNPNNLLKMKLNIKELTIITEMAVTIGLVMLTIGNFLGGQWANESWGRYWSWDPKETWALISIMVYAFVIHMRLVPGLRSRFAFNWVTILAYGSILMTYFGVNFYLSGMHSYASGDQIISYKFIGIAIGIWFLIGLTAYFKYRKYYKKEKKKLAQK